MNHFRLPTSVPTFPLNAVKCGLIVARSASIRFAEARQSLGAILDHPVDDRGDRLLPRRQLLVAFAGRELEVGDALGA